MRVAASRNERVERAQAQGDEQSADRVAVMRRGRSSRPPRRASDGWISPLSIYVSPAEVPTRQRMIDDAAKEAGRAPAGIRRINVVGAFGPSARGHGPSGDAERWADKLGEWTTRLGFDTFVFWPLADARAQLELVRARGRARRARPREGGPRDGSAAVTTEPLTTVPNRCGNDWSGRTIRTTGCCAPPTRPPPPPRGWCSPRTSPRATSPAPAESPCPCAAAPRLSGWSSKDGGIVVDLSGKDEFAVLDRDAHLVRIDAGARWGAVAEALAPAGFAISSGDHGNVGVGGPRHRRGHRLAGAPLRPDDRPRPCRRHRPALLHAGARRPRPPPRPVLGRPRRRGAASESC
jgi:hypothetical protein